MLSTDKLLHALVGALIVAMLAPLVGLVFAGAACVAAGLAKEAYDLSDPLHHTYDLRDAAATALGGALELAWLWLAAPIIARWLSA